ncbi:MAG TPA: nucleotidyl transferase AbiEii/AbiGii toxin family protein [Caldisericia bacterium]|nr:nucleotidyl transferase AbiEii/AbiGii toxin family protein [Caldisericia bacterium]HXK51752.1 nucleotidyl transferase AbiEii/AbiGii toxin family protein [Caldisericia bacterium]
MITLDRSKHRIVMTQLLLDFYKDSRISPLLGFKGGTAAMMFYDLPRFSVDLDFDIMADTSKRSINSALLYEYITKLLHRKYQVTDECMKFNTLFWLIRYELHFAQVKIEISTRNSILNHYHPVLFYGVTVHIMDAQDMIVYKMIAAMTRKQLANRDLFDLHYFLQSPYATSIRYSLLEALTKTSPKEYLLSLQKKIISIRSSHILNGLGEILEPSQKTWVKKNLLPELENLIQLQIDQM